MNSSRRICGIKKHKVIEEMYQTRNRKGPSHEAGFRSVHTVMQIFFLLIEGTLQTHGKMGWFATQIFFC